MNANALVEFIAANQLDMVQAMNWLQDQGIISDNAVFAEDVADDDARHAVKVMKQTPEFPMKLRHL